MYTYEHTDGEPDEELNGYGSVDEAESSGDELPFVPSNGYSEEVALFDDMNEGGVPQIGYTLGTEAEGDNSVDEGDLPPVQNSDVNLKCVML